MKKFLVLICAMLGYISCTRVVEEDLNVSDGTKFIVSAVEQRGEVYWYHLNEEGCKKFIFDKYGYASAKRYNIGDTLIIKIELITNNYDTIH